MNGLIKKALNILEEESGTDLSGVDIEKVKRIGFTVILVFLFGILFFGSIYTVKEQENALVTRFGKLEQITSAGLHFKMPIIDKVIFVDTKTQNMEIGYTSDEKKASESITEESMMITSDFNLVNVDFFVEYQIVDVEKYVFGSQDTETILRNALQAEIRSIIAKYTVDEILTTEKTMIQTQILESTNEKIDGYDLGLLVRGVSIQDAEPPTEEVAFAFKNVENAKQSKETAVNEANQYYNENIPKARSDADKIIKEAEAIKEERIAEAVGQTDRFNKMYSEYIKNPEVTKTRLYYEAMEEILPNVKVIIDNENDTLKMLPLNK